jgi:signal transduction histidine kinase
MISHAQNEAKLTLALEAARLGWWQLDFQSRELSASLQCKANHGLAPDQELTLDGVIAAIDGDHRDHFRHALDEASETGATFEIEVPHCWPDRSRHWLLIRGRVVDPGTLIGVTLDTTERRNMEEALRATEHALVDADRRKDDFLALLGHELRNPLAPILTAVAILQMKGPADPVLIKARDVIVRQTLHLSKLVDDLLDIGRITQGKMRLVKRRIQLEEILERAREMCAPGIESRGHSVSITIVDRGVVLDADAERIVQVICNLLNNASKYTDAGGRIEVKASRGDGAAIVSVRDSGIGIPADMLQVIFEPFVQVGSAGHRADGGLGLGLPLVKSLVEMHGGTVEARSAGVGHGAEFIVRLPVAPPS